MSLKTFIRFGLLGGALFVGTSVFADDEQPGATDTDTDTDTDTSAELVEDAPQPAKGGFQPVIELVASEPTMPAVSFGHAQHIGFGMACVDCHHTSQGAQVDMGCTTCHRDTRNGKMFEARGAFHKQCVKCHLEATQEDPETAAPYECEACHVPAGG